MRTEILQAQLPAAIEKALKILQAGGLVAFPTDTVYGVGTLAFDNAAIESIYPAKERPIEKAIPILIGTWIRLTLSRITSQTWPASSPPASGLDLSPASSPKSRLSPRQSLPLPPSPSEFPTTQTLLPYYTLPGRWLSLLPIFQANPAHPPRRKFMNNLVAAFH